MLVNAFPIRLGLVINPWIWIIQLRSINIITPNTIKMKLTTTYPWPPEIQSHIAVRSEMGHAKYKPINFT